jgi:hypothetical protein
MFIAASAYAQLYRWVDPDSGSIKFSSLPPSDPRVQAELVTPRSGPVPKQPATAGSALPSVAPLDTRWRELLGKLMRVTDKDVVSSPDSVRQDIEMLQALRAELDRTDPAGAPQRERDQLAVLERLRQSLTRAWQPKADK